MSILLGRSNESCTKLFGSIGKTSSRAVTPEAFFDDLFLHYESRPRELRETPGSKYGQLLPGYDPFQLFFNAIRQEHEKVTFRIIPNSIKEVDNK